MLSILLLQSTKAYKLKLTPLDFKGDIEEHSNHEKNLHRGIFVIVGVFYYSLSFSQVED